jgi:capsular polysaccharide transport system permease protein
MSSTSRYAPVGFWQELGAGWRNQSSVITALLLKDFTSRAKNGRLGIVWLIVEPMFMLVMMATVWYMVRRQTIDGVHVVLFLSSGLIIYSAIRSGMASIPSAIKSNSALLNYPQVKPLSCILARFVFEMTLLAVTAIVLYFLLWWFLDLSPVYNNPLQLFHVIAITLVFALGASLLLGVYGTLYESVGRVFSLISRPLMFLSCVMHSIRDLPNTARHYLLWNPVVDLVEYARASLFATPLLPSENLTYPTIWAVFLMGLGSIAYYANRFKLI